MRTYIVGEQLGTYLIQVDNDGKTRAIDRQGNKRDVSDDPLILDILYTLDFHKEQHEFASLQITSLESQIEYYQQQAHKVEMYRLIEDRAREVLLRHPNMVESFKLENSGWNFYDQDDQIVDHCHPHLNTFHRTFRQLCDAYDIRDMYVKLTPVYDVSRPAYDQFVMIVSEYRRNHDDPN